MGAKITIDKILAEEPYRSIVNLLAEYPDGLKLREIQFCIMQNHNVCNNLGEIEEYLGEKREQLIALDKIRPYQPKTINRMKKINYQQNELPSKERRCIRSNLENFLKKMMDSSNRVIGLLSNRKYILSNRITNLLLVKKDMEYLEKLKDNIISFDNGKINLYGSLPYGSRFFNRDYDREKTTVSEIIKDGNKEPKRPIDQLRERIRSMEKKEKKTKEKFEKAINKIRDGMDEIQTLIDHSQGWPISKDLSFKYILNKRYPLLDRQLLIIFRSYLLTLSENINSRVSDWYTVNSDIGNHGDYVITPDDELVKIFKKYFYPLMEIEEIRVMLDNHIINDEISIGFDRIINFLDFDTLYSNIVAVVRSNTIPIFNEDMKRKLVEEKPFTSDDLNKIHSYSPKETEEFWKRYFKSTDPQLQKRIEKSGIQKILKDKEPLNANDLINFHKAMLR